ncbi:hypothetical protein [Embleya sp. AB8]|uniref:hypothetical protein n=1 Tax=Embleya sp. AB8 TaxID=3156304 RepID=UPI003C7742B4
MGTRVQISATRILARKQRTHDLTVDVDHTYYVLASATPVLVHNSSCENIALGLSSTDEDPDALFNFADTLGAKMYTHWPQDKSWETYVRGILHPDSDAKIHFNLDGIRDPKTWAKETGTASPSGDFTGWELAMIEAAPASVQARVTWYLDGKVDKSPFSGG